MSTRHTLVGLVATALGCFITGTVFAEPPASGAAPPSSPSPPPAEPTAAPPAAAPPAAAPPTYAVPPGYMLVPIPRSDGQTRYDVQYPQGRGALPPGMELPYEAGDPIPPGYRLVEQRRRGLIIAGSILVGAPWVLGVTAATAADFKDGTGLLFIPVLGPWLMFATKAVRNSGTSCTASDGCTNGDRAGLRAVFLLDGLVQAGGAAMFVTGFLAPRKRLIRRDVVVSVLPARLGADGYGLSASGTF